MAIEITRNPGAMRFEITVDGQLAGTSEYVTRSGLTAFTHTVTDPDFAGRGLAKKLVGTALDAVRDDGDQVLPFCSFVSGYIQRNPEYLDLVPPDLRDRFEL